jgi:hypothetical protein
MISDNNHIIYSAEDIKRYWKGQLSPPEMHAMEKAALDDPFLADAMEGYGLAMQEHHEKKITTQLDEMHLQLQESTKGAVRSIVPVRSFRWWQVAAAAFVLIAAGYWIFSSGRSDADGLISKQEKNSNTAETATVQDSGVRDRAEAVLPGLTDTTEITAARDSKQSEELGLYKFNTPEKNLDKTAAPRSKKERALKSFKPDTQPAPFAGVKHQKLVEQNEARALVQPPANTDTVRKMETEVVKLPETFADREKDYNKITSNEPKLQNIVSGVVTDNRNNPLPNVFLRIDNKNSYTTDPSGNFKIPVADSVVNVSVSLQGYATQNFLLKSTHNGAGNIADNKIKLQSNDELAAYRQMMEKGYGKKAKDKADMAADLPKITQQDAQPVYGWLTWEQYLEKNKRVPPSNPNLTGEVAVSFEVNNKGERGGYKIEKSLSILHDIEAIRLVREGPEWKLNKGRKTRVTVIVRF